MCGIRVYGDWVTQDGQNLLWLSPDYRAAIFNNMVVLGHRSGRVTFLEFALS